MNDLTDPWWDEISITQERYDDMVSVYDQAVCLGIPTPQEARAARERYVTQHQQEIGKTRREVVVALGVLA